MYIKRLWCGLAFGFGLLLGLLWLLENGAPIGCEAARAAPSAGIRVCASGCAFASIQEAVDAAPPGELIEVAGGVYTDVHARNGVTQVVYISKTVTVRGGYGDSFREWNPDIYTTTLDARGQGRVIFISAVGASPVIEGFRITGGDAVGLGGDPWGGDAGGGIYVNVATPVISGNLISGNAAYRGGGLFANSPITLTGNTFAGNTAGSGGGLYLYGQPASLEANVVISNTATTGDGGGIMLNASDATLINTVIADNRLGNAARHGSGVYVYGASPRLLHASIARNGGGDGSGVYVNDPGMPGTQSAVAMTNTIVASHTVGVVVTQRNTVTLNATLWHANAGGNWGGTGAITHAKDYSGDPAFASDGYHLTVGSAAGDRGVVAGVAFDLDGEVRPMGGGYDLGVDEVPRRVYLPLALRDS
jgi:putative cofactor-binding repeat protein